MGRFYIDFDNVQKLPDFSVKFADKRLVVSSNQYMAVAAEAGGQILGYSRFASSRFADFWVLGLPFLEAYYSVFDYQNEQICFALST